MSSLSPPLLCASYIQYIYIHHYTRTMLSFAFDRLNYRVYTHTNDDDDVDELLLHFVSSNSIRNNNDNNRPIDRTY